MALNINWDRSQWLFIPTEFPWQQFSDETSWREALTGAYAQAGLTPEQLEWLGDYVTGLRANNALGAHRFAWFGDPLNLLLTVDVLEQPHDPTLTLDDLTGSEGSDDDVRAPVITAVRAEGLGEGHRVERAIRVPITSHETIDEPGGLASRAEEVLQYVFWTFRSGEIDVLVAVTHRDPIVMMAMLEELETFIDSITVIAD